MTLKAFIVVTTINVPKEILNHYCRNIGKFGHKEAVGFIIIGDRKTPEALKDVVRDISSQGFEVIYLDIPAQEDWLENYLGLSDIVPYNCDIRRVIGYLWGIEQGAEFIISVDDDNYPTDGDDFFGGHSIVGKYLDLPVVESSNRWWNNCSLMTTDPPGIIYPRGFPYKKRWNDEIYSEKIQRVRVAINAGLWLKDPDVDANTRLFHPIKTTGLVRDRIALAHGHFCPINTQNTAIIREAIPTYYFALQGAKIEGLVLDRFGDIWQGLFAKKVIDAMGDFVVFGRPLVIHDRNVRDLFNDLKVELEGMRFADFLADLLEEVKLTRTENYCDAYIQLADLSNRWIQNHDDVTEGIKKLFLRFNSAMRTWAEICRKIL